LQYYNYTAGNQYIAVYPQGVSSSREGPSYATPGVDDLQFTSDLLDHLNSTYCIDSNRIYASGKSNGAGFVDTLACSDHGDRFAAFAMASAALYTDNSEGNCTKKRAILESRGLNDTTIPYNGTANGNGGALPNVRSWVQWWAERNGCSSSDAAVQTVENGYTILSYKCSSLVTPVHYAVNALGHCWPSSSGLNYDAVHDSTGRCTDRVLDFTPVVLAWFGNWTLATAPQN
jgi:poly(3-hydroxybutyrate) depolymerase